MFIYAGYLLSSISHCSRIVGGMTFPKVHGCHYANLKFGRQLRMHTSLCKRCAIEDCRSFAVTGVDLSQLRSSLILPHLSRTTEKDSLILIDDKELCLNLVKLVCLVHSTLEDCSSWIHTQIFGRFGHFLAGFLTFLDPRYLTSGPD